MRKRGTKLDEKTKAEIIRLSKKGYGPAYIARHLGLHKSTVRRHIELDLEAKVMESRSFQKHIDDIANTFKGIVSTKRTELMHAAFMHFTEEYPEYVHLTNCQDISKAEIDKMELLADSRNFKFCAKCPICQNIKRQLRESSRGVAQLFTNSSS